MKKKLWAIFFAVAILFTNVDAKIEKINNVNINYEILRDGFSKFKKEDLRLKEFKKELRINLDGEDITSSFKSGVYAIEGSSAIGLRDFANAIGADINWNGEESLIELKKDGYFVELPIGRRVVYINGKFYEIKIPAVIDKNKNTTYIPLRTIAEALGYGVDFENETFTANLLEDAGNGESLKEVDIKNISKKNIEAEKIEINKPSIVTNSISSYEDFKNLMFENMYYTISHVDFNLPNGYSHMNEYTERFIKENESRGVLSKITWQASEKNGSIDIKYIHTKNQGDMINSFCEAWVLKNIKPTMNDYEKVKAIHDFIVNKNDYNYKDFTSYDYNYVPVAEGNYNVFSPASILFGKGVVCEAYTAAFYKDGKTFWTRCKNAKWKCIF